MGRIIWIDGLFLSIFMHTISAIFAHLRYPINHMRTHLDLDESLLDEVIALGAFPTKRAAVMTALEELAKRFKRRELAAMRGKVAWEGDVAQWRASRTPARPG